MQNFEWTKKEYYGIFYTGSYVNWLANRLIPCFGTLQIYSSEFLLLLQCNIAIWSSAPKHSGISDSDLTIKIHLPRKQCFLFHSLRRSSLNMGTT